jgi:hypothetical protein
MNNNKNIRTIQGVGEKTEYKSKIIIEDNPTNKEQKKGFTINVTSDPACIKFHTVTFYKPVRLYKVTNVLKGINHFTFGSLSTTRQRGKYYYPSPIKFKVATIAIDKKLFNIGDSLTYYSKEIIDYSQVLIDQKRLQMYTKQKFDVCIAVCDQNLLLSRRLGNLTYAASGLAKNVIFVVTTSKNIDELVTKNIANKVQSRSNKPLIVMEVCNKPIASQQKFITDAIIQYTSFCFKVKNVVYCIIASVINFC